MHTNIDSLVELLYAFLIQNLSKYYVDYYKSLIFAEEKHFRVLCRYSAMLLQILFISALSPSSEKTVVNIFFNR